MKNSNFPYNFLICLLIIMISIGFFLILTIEYFKYILSKFLLQSKETQLHFILVLIQIFACQVIFVFICGFPVAYHTNSALYSPTLVVLMKFWLILGLVTILEALAVLGVLWKVNQSAQDTFEGQMYQGIEEYFNPEWRLIWDAVQYHEQCCGVNNHEDWRNCWFDELKSESSEAYIPYSCCQNRTQCFRNIVPIQVRDKQINVAVIDTSKINVNGCLLEIVRQCTQVTNVVAIEVLVLVAFFVSMKALIRRRGKLKNFKELTDFKGPQKFKRAPMLEKFGLIFLNFSSW